MEGLKSALMARGVDTATATRQAQAAAFDMVERQASMLAFVDTSRILAVVFLLMLPLLLLMRRPTRRGGGMPAH